MTAITRGTNGANRARDAFLRVLAAHCNVSEAAKAAGIGRRTAYNWRDSDADFAAAWDEAEQTAADQLEREAWRRATTGKSDRMLEILLKGHRPEKYVDRIKAEHSGSVPVIFNFNRQAEAPDAG